VKALFLFFLGFAAGLSLTSCRRSGTPSSPSAESAEILDPRAQMFKAMDSVTSYRLSEVAEYDAVEAHNGTEKYDAAKDETEVEAACPSRSHYRLIRNGQIKQDQYFIEGAEISQSRGEWQVNRRNFTRAPGCPGKSFNSFPGMDNVLSGRTYLNLSVVTVYHERIKLTKGAVEAVGYEPCQIWQSAFIGNFEVPYEVQYWIGVADNLPRRFLLTAPGRRVQILYSDWNSPGINVPSPI
jgi:hypothetical protein